MHFDITFFTEMVDNSYLMVKQKPGIGIKQYAYCNFDYGIVPMPCSPLVHVAFVIDGCGFYDGIFAKPGDVIAYGLNKKPIIGDLRKITVYIISMEFTLFYKLTGLKPSECQNFIVFSYKDELYQLGLKLFELPICDWEYEIDKFVYKCLARDKNNFNDQALRVINASNLISINACKDLIGITNYLNVSYRQLQRDFVNFIGLTPNELRNISRFYYAVDNLKSTSLIESAANSGYCDQAHMTREFKKISTLTPSQIRKNELKSQKKWITDIFHV